jgi:putative FmdB family regulatory protein
MPLFDYKCADCGARYEVLVRGRETEEELRCPRCGSIHHKRLVSAASISVGGNISVGGSSFDAPSSCDTGGCCGGFCGTD